MTYNNWDEAVTAGKSRSKRCNVGFKRLDEAVGALKTESGDIDLRETAAIFLMRYLEYPDGRPAALSVMNWIVSSDWTGSETVKQIQGKLNDIPQA